MECRKDNLCCDRHPRWRGAGSQGRAAMVFDQLPRAVPLVQASFTKTSIVFEFTVEVLRIA